MAVLNDILLLAGCAGHMAGGANGEVIVELSF
jgi:hypothetical protein